MAAFEFSGVSTISASQLEVSSQGSMIAVAQNSAVQCVICLDTVSSKAIALPCRHEQFGFPMSEELARASTGVSIVQS